MALVKHSKRTMRKPCRTCGSKALYWAHDTDQPGDYCGECGKRGKWVKIEPDGSLHACGGKTDSQENNDEPEPTDWERETDRENCEDMSVESSIPSAVAGNDAFAAFQQFMSAMAPKVDRADVEAMIKQQLDTIVFPTRTVVERASGERVEIEGKSHVKLADVTTDILAGEHVMMVGPAGTGKSTIAEQAAESLGLSYYSISLSPQTPSSQILGYMQAEGKYVRTLFREAYENGGVFHFDEFDNGHPSVLAVINASLANGQMAFPDTMVKRHEDFRCVASANTYGKGADRQYVGRQQIDAATLDRFAIETIDVDESLETDLCHGTGLESAQVRRVLSTVRKLRGNAVAKGMTVVISPRASVGMCRLLAAGKTWESASESRLRRGMSDQDWDKLNA